LLYFLLIKLVGYKNAGGLACALYSAYLIIMFIYSMFFSPFTRYVRFMTAGFFILLAITVALLLFVFLTRFAVGSGKGGGTDA
jgi:hypothetical protein